MSANVSWLCLPPSKGRGYGEDGGVHVHLMSVRTEDTRLISRAFILASSRGPPKPGSAADAVQPTVSWSVECSIVIRVCQWMRRCAKVAAGHEDLVNVLRARKRSSERIAMALTRRTATARISERIYQMRLHM